jgi:hypothetical protein
VLWAWNLELQKRPDVQQGDTADNRWYKETRLSSGAILRSQNYNHLITFPLFHYPPQRVTLKLHTTAVTRLKLDSFTLEVYIDIVFFHNFFFSLGPISWFAGEKKRRWNFIGVGGSLLWRVVLLLQRIQIKCKGDDCNW